MLKIIIPYFGVILTNIFGFNILKSYIVILYDRNVYLDVLIVHFVSISYVHVSLSLPIPHLYHENILILLTRESVSPLHGPLIRIARYLLHNVSRACTSQPVD